MHPSRLATLSLNSGSEAQGSRPTLYKAADQFSLPGRRARPCGYTEYG